MLPEKGRSNSTKNNLNLWKNLFSSPGDIYSAPSVGMDDGKPDHIRPFLSNGVFYLMGCLMDIMPVQYLDIVLIFFKYRTNVIEADRHHSSIFCIESVFKTVGINKEYFQTWSNDSLLFLTSQSFC